MCEATVFISAQEGERPVMEGLSLLEADGEEVTVIDLFGKQATYRARVKKFSLLEHKVVLEPR